MNFHHQLRYLIGLNTKPALIPVMIINQNNANDNANKNKIVIKHNKHLYLYPPIIT